MFYLSHSTRRIYESLNYAITISDECLSPARRQVIISTHPAISFDPREHTSVKCKSGYNLGVFKTILFSHSRNLFQNVSSVICLVWALMVQCMVRSVWVLSLHESVFCHNFLWLGPFLTKSIFISQLEALAWWHIMRAFDVFTYTLHVFRPLKYFSWKLGPTVTLGIRYFQKSDWRI